MAVAAVDVPPGPVAVTVTLYVVPLVSPLQVPLDTRVVNVAPQPVTVYDEALATSFQLSAMLPLPAVAVRPAGVVGAGVVGVGVGVDAGAALPVGAAVPFMATYAWSVPTVASLALNIAVMTLPMAAATTTSATQMPAIMRPYSTTEEPESPRARR